MAKSYDMQLKGYVGGWRFNSLDVDSFLSQNAGKPVNILICSRGGSTAEGLAISAAFKNHGDVHVHFVGLNASAATIAALGAKTVSMDRDALFLVHRCSQEVFTWDFLNAEDIAKSIEDLEHIRKNLEKIDQVVASAYASKCKKDSKSLLELMSKDSWLSAKETLEWGFINEITDFEEDLPPVIDESVVSFLNDEGLPVPDKFTTNSTSLFNRLSALFRSFMKDNPNSEKNMEKKPETVSVDQETPDYASQIAEKDAEINALKQEIASLKAEPADEKVSVVTAPEQKSDDDDFIKSFNDAKKLFNSLP